jgi:acetyl-CoA carboxylase carboxyl transferase subunit beta
MLDRVTHRKDMRDELIRITRMLMGLSPAVAGDLPPPGPGETGSGPQNAAPDAETAQP